MLRLAFLSFILCAAVWPTPGESGTATQWRRKLAVPGGYIEHMTLVKDDVVWAVGAGGIFVSVDAGRSWQHTFADDLLLRHAEGFGDHGWAVGSIGAIAVTDDGGRTWTAQHSGTDIHLTSVAAIDADSAVVTGAGQGFSDAIALPIAHTLLRTDDGGATWREFTLADDFVARRVDFLPDGDHGWISAERCEPQPNGFGCAEFVEAMFRTDDGGDTWEQVSTDHAPYFFEFVTAEVGWAVVSACDTVCTSSALRTTDGGGTWHTLPSPPTTGSGPGSVDPIDADTAIAGVQECADTCTVAYFITRNGGLTWSPLSSAAPSSSARVAFLDESRAVRLTPAEWSDDGGATWHEAEFPVVAGSAAFDFTDSRHGWFAASELLRTTDGGATWASVSDRRFGALDFVSATTGWGAQVDCFNYCRGAVLKTEDGGATWREQRNLTDLQDAPSLVFVDESHGWIIASSAPSGAASMLHTADGGETWRAQHPPAANPYGGRDLIIVDRNVLWAVTSTCAPNVDACSLLPHVSTDGGDTWTTTSPILDEEGCGAHGIAASGARHAWIAGLRCRNFSEPLLHRTTDGGATWTTDDRGFVGDPGNLTFFDLHVGRSFGAVCPEPPGGDCHGTIFRTNDGGATWAEETTAVRPSGYQGLRTQFVTPENIWHVNQDGGGVLALFRHELFLYDGAGPPILSPDAGSGRSTGAAVVGLALGLGLLCAGVGLLMAGRRAAARRTIV